jgi:hypothetical protein
MKFYFFDHDESDDILNHLKRIEHKLEDIMALSSEALAAVQAESTAVDSFITLFQSLQAQLAAALAGLTVPPAVQADIDAIFALSNTEAAKIASATTTTPTGAPVTPAPAVKKS